MNKQKIAHIYWLAPEEGGRRHLPSGYRYVSVAQFLSSSTDSLPQLWSVIIESAEPLDTSTHAIVHVSFLAPEHAPAHLLSPGIQFHLLEGNRTVAIGEIIEDGQLMANVKSMGATRH